ncbi:MAG TPA: hypothetical protein VGT44_06520 [Ktedonobacteraceae bacterium]|nr:hypothetical protein [Ktedonobacteraceae bacterium]
MNQTKLDLHQNDIDLEISDLPGTDHNPASRAPAFIRALAEHPRLRVRFWRLGTAALAFILLVLVLSSSFPQIQQGLQYLFAPPSPTATIQLPGLSSAQAIPLHGRQKTSITIAVNSKPLIVPLTEALGPVPSACLHTTPTRAFDAPSFSPGLGALPMWVTGFSNPAAGQRAVLDHLQRAQPPEAGWFQQVLLVSSTNFTGAITIQGGIEGSILPLWFGVFPPGIAPRSSFGLIQTITVHPLDASFSNHTTGDQAWSILPINLYIAQAGCYYLKATWNTGVWTAYFAAGK